jgi:hypothetical protein
LFFLFIPTGCYFFTISQIEIGNIVLENPFFEAISILPRWLYIVYYLSAVLVISVILLYFLTTYYILHKKRTKRIHAKYSDLLVGYLFDYLYDETSSDKEKRAKLMRIKKCLRSDVTKRIFLNRLRRVHLQMDGEIKERNFNLLKALQYTNFLRAYLQSPYLRHKLFALRIISDFHLQGYEGYIYKLTKKNNKILNSEALVTLVKLYIYDDHLFLVDFHKKLSVWDVNMIINKVQQQRNNNFNHLKLVNSEIPEISVVGIILSRLDKQIQLKKEIKKKIESPVNLVSEQAFLTYISFASCEEDFEYLTYRFEAASDIAKLQIIKAIALFKNKRQKTKFLNWVVENKPTLFKIEAIRILLNIDFHFYNTKYKNTADTSIKNAILHVENTYY